MPTGLGEMTELRLCYFEKSRSLDILRELLAEGYFVRSGEIRPWLFFCPPAAVN